MRWVGLFMMGKATAFAFFFALLSPNQEACAQSGRINLVGIVIDDSTGAPVSRVLVRPKGSFKGTYSNQEGRFELSTSRRRPLILSIDKTQYIPIEMVVEDTSLIQVQLVAESSVFPKTVSSPSRKTEDISRSALSVDKMTYRDIRNAPAFNFYPAIGNLRGAYLNSSGMVVQSISPAGTTSSVNRRSLQLADGVDTQVPGEYYNLGNFYGVPELDVESIEWVPINSSPVYGPNSMNGVLTLNSKSPFDHPGLSALGKVGFASVGTLGGDELTPVYEVGLRYALAYKNVIGVKVNFSKIEGEDWQGYDAQNVRSGSLPLSTRATDPGYDGASSYGDEIFSLLPFGSAGGDQVVTRTGFDERDLSPSEMNNRKFGIALHFRPLPTLEAILQYQTAAGNSIFQADNRGVLNNIHSDILKLELRGTHFFLRAYESYLEISTSYDLSLLGQALNLFVKSNTEWFRDYSTVFLEPPFDQSTHLAGRRFADGIGLNQFGNNTPRLEPGTAEFEDVKERLIDERIPFISSVRAPVENQNRLTHFEGLYDFSEWTSLVDVQVGYMVRSQEINQESELINNVFEDQSFNQVGGFVQVGKSLLQDQLTLSTALRYDINNIYEGRFSPRLSGVYSINREHHIRASFQQGFRDPSLQEMFVVRPNGNGDLRGGFNDLNVTTIQPGFSGQLPPLIGFAIFESHVEAFSKAVETEVAEGTPRTTAEQNNLQILNAGILSQQSGLSTIRQEENQTIEVGYRTWLQDRLQADFSFFYNTLENAIGQTSLIRPFGTQPPGLDLAAAARLVKDPRTHQRITYYQNSDRQINSRGLMLGLKYLLPRNYWLGLNGTWINFDETEFDVVDVSFNAPEYNANVFFGNPSVTPDIGFQIIFRWQDSFKWSTPYGDGVIGSYGVFDAQVSYRIPRLKSRIKVGGTNLLNTKYTNNLSGGEIGGLYYISLSLDDLALF